jgi:hypothetical protein
MCCTTAPYGMIYVPKHERDPEKYKDWVLRLMRDPVDSSVRGLSKEQVVKDVFSWRWYHKMRTYAIVNKLNELGILSAGNTRHKPGLWSRQVVIQMLKNRSYIGEHIENGTIFLGPQFVEREVFEGVRQMFAENKKHQNGRPTKKCLFSNFFWCLKCRHRMITNPGSSKRKISTATYGCGDIVWKPCRKICDAPEVRVQKVEEAGWKAIWMHITQPALLLANAGAYYDSLPKASGMARLEKELAAVTQMEKTQRMVRSSVMNEHKGIALIKADQRRIAEIKAELRAAGSVVTVPTHAVEAGRRRIAAGPEPETYGERRPVLEKLVDLRISYYHGQLEIEGKVAVPDAAEAQNWNSRVGADAERRCEHDGPREPLGACQGTEGQFHGKQRDHD